MAFVDIGAGDPHYYDLPTNRDPAEFWKWIIVAIDEWALRVERAIGLGVIASGPQIYPSRAST
jgi:hypothetical protein